MASIIPVPAADPARFALASFVSACGGNPPDWLREEFAEAENALAALNPFRDALARVLPYAESRAEDMDDEARERPDDADVASYRDKAVAAVDDAKALLAGSPAPQTADALSLTAAERDMLGRALSDRMSIYLATRDETERQAATRLLMRLQGHDLKPEPAADVPDIYSGLCSTRAFLLAEAYRHRGQAGASRTWRKDTGMAEGKLFSAAADHLGALIDQLGAILPASSGRADFEVRTVDGADIFEPISSAAPQWLIDGVPDWVPTGDGLCLPKTAGQSYALREELTGQAFSIKHRRPGAREEA